MAVSRKVRQRLTRLLRVGCFAATVLLIHWQHQKHLAGRLAGRDWQDLLPEIQQVLPEAASVAVSDAPAEVPSLVNTDGTVIGRLVRTSPDADHIIGFSGPTDVLLVADTDEKVLAVRILDSSDTREHVRQIVDDEFFLASLIERSLDDLKHPTDIDTVSGATLTSVAILEAIRYRLAAEQGSGAAVLQTLRFPDPPRLTDVQLLYADAVAVERAPDSQHQWLVRDQAGQIVGSLLRTSPAADNLIGYQGPTDSLIAFDSAGQVTGVAVGVSFDNEPYVGYVREDEYFRSLFNQWTVAELSTVDPQEEQIEGVAGATMTSQSVADCLVMTAQAYVDEQRRLEIERNRPAPPTLAARLITARNLSTIGITVLGIVLGLTHLRGRRWLRLVFQVLVIVWLGLMNGDMVSQALLLGWAQSGIPWQNAFGLTFLTVAAVLIPIGTGHNVYCSHVCPHGAAQQLLRNRLPWRLRLPKLLQRVLKLIPAALMVLVVAIGMLRLPISAVDLEAFDAWVWGIAGVATISIAVIGLVASLFVPMAYCRFGCPTGALLDYLRPGSAGWKDVLSVVLVVVSALLLVR